MTYKRYQALLSLATAQGLNLQTIKDFYEFAIVYSNIKVEDLQKATR